MCSNDALTALMKLLGSIVPCWTKRSDEMTFRDHASAVTVAVLLTIAVLGVVYGHVLLLGPYLSTFASAFLVAAALRQVCEWGGVVNYTKKKKKKKKKR
jgi:hypothetical protein